MRACEVVREGGTNVGGVDDLENKAEVVDAELESGG